MKKERCEYCGALMEVLERNLWYCELKKCTDKMCDEYNNWLILTPVGNFLDGC